MEWSPHFENIFVSSGEDSEMIVWDCAKMGEENEINETRTEDPHELLFRHSGHRGFLFVYLFAHLFIIFIF